MSRRRFLYSLPVLLCASLAFAHTPYRQWKVYRQRHLLIFAARTDPAAYDLCEELARLLLEHLPTSRAEAARAPDVQRIASLITTDQADFALLARDSALALAQRRGDFADYVPAELRALVENDKYQLLCRAEVPKQHAFLVVQVLIEQGGQWGLTVPNRPAPQADAVPTHDGALAFLRGEKLE
ncbi:MAG: hypothetical protein ABL878_14035 [Burkholderiales bacterium]